MAGNSSASFAVAKRIYDCIGITAWSGFGGQWLETVGWRICGVESTETLGTATDTVLRIMYIMLNDVFGLLAAPFSRLRKFETFPAKLSATPIEYAQI